MKCLPEKKSNKIRHNCADPRVLTSRKNVEEAYDQYQLSPEFENKNTLKDSFNKAYKTVIEDRLTHKIRKIDEAHRNNQYKLSWKLINEISGRKVTKQGQLDWDTKKTERKTSTSTFTVCVDLFESWNSAMQP